MPDATESTSEYQRRLSQSVETSPQQANAFINHQGYTMSSSAQQWNVSHREKTNAKGIMLKCLTDVSKICIQFILSEYVYFIAILSDHLSSSFSLARQRRRQPLPLEQTQPPMNE